MQTINEVKQEIGLIFSEIIGDIRLKTYFSYHAIFKDRLMIALYQNEDLYLRLSTEHMLAFPQQVDTFNLSDNKIGLQSKKFYYIPKNILNTELFCTLVNSTIDELHKEKEELNQKRSKQIRTLPNMNLKLERMLKKVGIQSIQDFIDTGYISAFIKLIMQGFDPTEELLFKLNGALNHQYIYTFTHQQKRELLREVNKELYSIGLRQRFIIN